MSEELDKIIKVLNKKYNSINILDNEEESHEYISTGNLALDLILDGGIAWGYVGEWIGFSGSGKSLLLQQLLADAQKKYNAVGIWFDREKSLFKKRARELGIDLKRVIRIEPQDIVTVQDLKNVTSDVLAETKDIEYRFIAIDSISAFDQEGDKADMGKKAQGFHQLFRKIIPHMNNKTSLHFANQRTFKIGVMFGDPTTSTGGEGPKYYSTYRIKLDDKRALVDSKKGGEIVGNWIEATVIKTRLGPNFRRIYFPFYYREGIPHYGGYARLLAMRGYLQPKNKKEFASFNQVTVKYGDKEFSEFDIEDKLKDYPELVFTEFPDFNLNKEDGEEEQ